MESAENWLEVTGGDILKSSTQIWFHMNMTRSKNQEFLIAPTGKKYLNMMLSLFFQLKWKKLRFYMIIVEIGWFRIRLRVYMLNTITNIQEIQILSKVSSKCYPRILRSKLEVFWVVDLQLILVDHRFNQWFKVKSI